MTNKKISLFVMTLVLSNNAWAQAPSWIDRTERQVIGGDIIHWGTGGAMTAEVALFKARHMALKTLIEECGGVASKNIIPRKQYVESQDLGGYQAFAQVSIEFDACEASKRKSAKIQENQKIVEGQKLYDKLLGFADRNSPEAKDFEEMIRKALDKNAEIREEQIGSLRDEIDNLRAELRAGVQPVLPVKLPATNSMKVMCMAQYNMMKQTLMNHAYPYNGNVAATELLPEYNQVEQQRLMCSRLE